LAKTLNGLKVKIKNVEISVVDLSLARI